MNPERFLVIGKRNCGKSALAESLLEAGGDVLTYLGTLPRTPGTLPRIQRHEARRGAQWSTLELQGTLDADLAALHALLAAGIPFLLDGLAAYLTAHCFSRHGEPTGDAVRIMRFLREELPRHRGTWGVVDPSPQAFLEDGYPLVAHLLHKIHAIIQDSGKAEIIRLS